MAFDKNKCSEHQMTIECWIAQEFHAIVLIFIRTEIVCMCEYASVPSVCVIKANVRCVIAYSLQVKANEGILNLI
jgi:hypothetical protein